MGVGGVIFILVTQFYDQNSSLDADRRWFLISYMGKEKNKLEKQRTIIGGDKRGINSYCNSNSKVLAVYHILKFIIANESHQLVI